MSKNHRKIPFEKFWRAASLLDYPDSKLSEELGLSSGTVSGWRKVGQVPAYAEHAVAGLLASATLPPRPEAPEPRVLVCFPTQDQLAPLRTVLDAMHVQCCEVGSSTVVHRHK